jgi:hypothetical protein
MWRIPVQPHLLEDQKLLLAGEVLTMKLPHLLEDQKLLLAGGTLIVKLLLKGI